MSKPAGGGGKGRKKEQKATFSPFLLPSSLIDDRASENREVAHEDLACSLLRPRDPNRTQTRRPGAKKALGSPSRSFARVCVRHHFRAELLNTFVKEWRSNIYCPPRPMA